MTEHESKAPEARSERDKILEVESERLAIAAHDVKNGLNVVSLAAHQLVALRLGGEDGVKVKRIAEMLHRASRRVSDTMRDLVDLSRLEMGAVKIEKKKIDLERIFDEPLERLRPQHTERDVRFQLELDPSARGLRFSGDLERLRAVVAVLLSNAARFSPEHGTVTLHVALVGPDLQIAISDRGPGIAPDRLETLFVRPPPVRGEPRSLGRGLPLAKGIVEAHGGQLHLTTTPGSGTTATVTLPVT